MLDPYEGKINTNLYFENAVKVPPATNSKFVQNVISEKNRDEIINEVFAKSALQKERNTESEITERLAVEISDLRRKRFIEEKKRQQLRETNHELKELEAKLRAAYISKSLAAQIAEREALRAQEKALQRKEEQLLERARIHNEEAEKIRMEEDHRKKMLFRQDLLEQISYMQQEKAKKYQDFLKEKAIIDEIIRKIYEEQLEEMREKMQRKIQFKEEMDEFVRQQKEWKKQMTQETEEENKRILEFLQSREMDVAEKARQKEMERKLREAISDQIGQKIFSIQEQKRKREELLQDLHVEERKALEEEKVREEMEKKLRERISARLKLQEYREDIMRRKLEEQEEDRRYREEQMRILAERDKLNLLSDEKRRKKILEHRRAIQECLEEKKRRRAEEFAIILKEREQDLREEKKRQELIEEERIRLLKEHAYAVLGYLPPGILKESDREHLALPPKVQTNIKNYGKLNS